MDFIPSDGIVLSKCYLYFAKAQYLITTNNRIKVKEQIVSNNPYRVKNKNEEIERLNQIIIELKEEINKIRIEKCKENELKEFSNELGKIEIVEVNKTVFQRYKRFNQESMKISFKEVEISYIIKKIRSTKKNKEKEGNSGIELRSEKIK